MRGEGDKNLLHTFTFLQKQQKALEANLAHYNNSCS